jgi:hypothetical protein
MTRTWPEDWESRQRGDSCFFCADLSERSFYSGRISEALLERGRAIRRAFMPCHVNYLLLGNLALHLYVHVVPRYLDDPAPGMPLPWAPSPVPEDVFDRQFSQLRDLSREANR